MSLKKIFNFKYSQEKLSQNSKIPIFSISLVRINSLLHFWGLHNDQNHPIWPKHPHIEVMYNVQLEQCEESKLKLQKKSAFIK